MDMTDSDDDDETFIYELQMNQANDVKNLRKQIDKIEDIIKYMERDNEEIWKLIEKRKEKKRI